MHVVKSYVGNLHRIPFAHWSSLNGCLYALMVSNMENILMHFIIRTSFQVWAQSALQDLFHIMLSKISLSIYILPAGGQVRAGLVFYDGLLWVVELNSMLCNWYLSFHLVNMRMFDYLMASVFRWHVVNIKQVDCPAKLICSILITYVILKEL